MVNRKFFCFMLSFSATASFAASQEAIDQTEQNQVVSESSIRSLFQKSNLQQLAEFLQANPNYVLAKIGTDEGGTPLHLACVEGYHGVARLLIEMGADVNAKDNHGATPLSWAIEVNHAEIVKLLLEALACPGDLSEDELCQLDRILPSWQEIREYSLKPMKAFLGTVFGELMIQRSILPGQSSTALADLALEIADKQDPEIHQLLQKAFAEKAMRYRQCVSDAIPYDIFSLIFQFSVGQSRRQAQAEAKANEICEYHNELS